MLDSEFAPKHPRSIIEDMFHRVWYTLQNMVEEIHIQHPAEDEFTTVQLKMLSQSASDLAFSRIHPPLEPMGIPGSSRQSRLCASPRLSNVCPVSVHAYSHFPNQLSTTNPYTEFQRPDSDRQRVPTPANIQDLPMTCQNDFTIHQFDKEIPELSAWISDENLIGSRDVGSSTIHQVLYQASTTLSTTALERRSTPTWIPPTSLSMRIVPKPKTAKEPAKPECLTFSIMSREYLMQLRMNILALRNGGSSRFSCKSDVAQIFKQLDETEGVHAFNHRALLFHLTRIRDKITQEVKLRKASAVLPERGARKVEDQVLDILVERIHKGAKCGAKIGSLRSWRQRFNAERTKIKNMLCRARIWAKLIEEFGLGILILVPWSGNRGSLNGRYQSMKDTDQKKLCCLLRRQNDSVIQEAASALTPFIECIWEGLEPPRLQIESEDAIHADRDPSLVINLLKECSDLQDFSSG